MAEKQSVPALRHIQCQGFLRAVCLRKEPGGVTCSAWGQLHLPLLSCFEAQQQIQTLNCAVAFLLHPNPFKSPSDMHMENPSQIHKVS